MKNLPLLFILIFLFACTSEKARENASTSELNDGSVPIQIDVALTETELLTSDLYEIDSIVVLETIESSLIGKVGKLEVFEDNLFVLDDIANKLTIFDNEGSFIGNVGKQGGGPGEYSRIQDFCIDKENSRVIILDDLHNLYFFDANANYLETHRGVTPASSIGTVSSGVVALFSELKSSSHPYGDYKLKIYDYIKKEVTVTEFLADEPQIVPYFSHPLSQTSLGLSLFYSTTDTIYSVLANGIKPKYVMNYEGDLKRPDDFFENLPTGEWKSKFIMESGYAGPPKDFLETDEHIFFRFALGGLLYQNLFDKVSQKLIFSNKTIANDYFFGSNKAPISAIAVTESQFILLVEPENIKFLSDYKKSQNKVVDYHPILKPVLENITGEENALLLFVKMK